MKRKFMYDEHTEEIITKNYDNLMNIFNSVIKKEKKCYHDDAILINELIQLLRNKGCMPKFTTMIRSIQPDKIEMAEFIADCFNMKNIYKDIIVRAIDKLRYNLRNIKNNVKCSLCDADAIFNFYHFPPICCYEHKLPDMVKKNNLCVERDCVIQSRYGYAEEKNTLCCSIHRKPGMVDKKLKKIKKKSDVN